MDTQWEGTLPADISSPAESSEDEYVSAEEEDIGYSGSVTRSTARKLQHVEAPSKANRLLMAHFGPEPVVPSQPQKYIITKFVVFCREFWNKLSQ